jgi:hypothetical protein
MDKHQVRLAALRDFDAAFDRALMSALASSGNAVAWRGSATTRREQMQQIASYSITSSACSRSDDAFGVHCQ